jgi:hypothetical protein
LYLAATLRNDQAANANDRETYASTYYPDTPGPSAAQVLFNFCWNLWFWVTDSRGAPTKDCTVVIFARDERKWEGTSRYISAARPDQDGKFRVGGLPPGDYQAVALDRIEPGQWGDPDVLSRIRDQAATLSLGAGETKVLDLKLTLGS